MIFRRPTVDVGVAAVIEIGLGGCAGILEFELTGTHVAGYQGMRAKPDVRSLFSTIETLGTVVFVYLYPVLSVHFSNALRDVVRDGYGHSRI